MRTRRPDRRREACASPQFEPLEERVLLTAAVEVAASAAVAYPTIVASSVSPSSTGPPGGALTPEMIRGAYGFNQVYFGSILGTGAGQTVAVIDAYDYPTAAADLAAFSTQYNLPQFNVSGGPTFTRVAQDGSTNYPAPNYPQGSGNSTSWEIESALDIEWVHAVAPMANIILVEANSPTLGNLITAAVGWARSQPGVVAVSMSFSSSDSANETTYDSTFTSPAGGGVTFVAATGDTGVPSGYPAYSPNVVAVGGTSLTVSSSPYAWQTETGWSGSGGGISGYEIQPAYQPGVVTQSSTWRTNPDVSMDADPNTGVAVYDSWDYPSSPWSQWGGTSLATPMFAALIAVVDQGRALQSLPSLDGRTQTLPALYQVPTEDFHDITSGNNGYAAGSGYDLVTGRGSPVANKLIPDLVASYGTISGKAFADNNGNGTLDAGEPGLAGATVFLDANNNGVQDAAAVFTVASSNVPKAIPRNTTTSTLTVSPVSTLITRVTVTLNITFTRDSALSAYLIGPDGTQITLLFANGGTGKNFTNTTFSDGSPNISTGTAPFSGTYAPSSGLLSSFNGKSPAGVWTLEMYNSSRNATGTLNSWSLNFTTAEQATTTDAGGNYSFGNLPAGLYNVRQVVPANNVQTGPNPGSVPIGANGVTVAGNMTGGNFGDFPTVFAAAGSGGGFYVRSDSTGTRVQISAGGAPQTPPAYQVALSLLTGLTFNLAGQNETLIVDFSNGSPIPSGNISLLGGAGLQTGLQVIGSSPPQIFTMTDSQVGLAGGSAILYQNLASLGFSDGTLTVSAASNFTTPLTINVNAGTLNLNTAAGTGNLSLNVAGGASAYFNLPTSSNLVLSGLNVANGGLAAMPQNLVHPSVLTVSSLNLGTLGVTGGHLDLNNNALAISYTGSSPISTIQSLIANGNIMSTTVNNDGLLAIGFGEASVVGFAGGESWPNYMSTPVINNTAQMILVMPTVNGDCYLRGIADGDSFGTVFANYGLYPYPDLSNPDNIPITWTSGDLYNQGWISGDSFGTVFANYGVSMQSLGYWPAPAGGSLGLGGNPVIVVPEPTTLALLALGGVGSPVTEAVASPASAGAASPGIAPTGAGNSISGNLGVVVISPTVTTVQANSVMLASINIGPVRPAAVASDPPTETDPDLDFDLMHPRTWHALQPRVFVTGRRA